jgi:hypothetical protein
MPQPNTQIKNNIGIVSSGNWAVWDVTTLLSLGEINSFNIVSFEDDGSAFYSKEYEDKTKTPYLELRLIPSSEDSGFDAVEFTDIEDVYSDNAGVVEMEDSLIINDVNDIDNEIIIQDSELYKDEILYSDVSSYEDSFVSIDIVSADIKVDNSAESSCSCNILE